ncbi:MAG: hypothetical protein M5U23_01365 [Acidimicrobiia bacterium]|nr:hypothetical protein [Acidimicrobiia bacterium]
MKYEHHFGTDDPAAAVQLYWIPLGAGGVGFVRFNGRVYEVVQARLEHRRRLDLYHTALEVHLEGCRYTIENGWPSPNADIASRGVVAEGPVFSRALMRYRLFRYEVRCWHDGKIPDAHLAVDSPQLLTEDPQQARRVLDCVGSTPTLTWGRDEIGAGEMWNSNSVTAWVLGRSGLPVDTIHPPSHGRVPGWMAGIRAANLSNPTEPDVVGR